MSRASFPPRRPGARARLSLEPCNSHQACLQPCLAAQLLHCRILGYVLCRLSVAAIAGIVVAATCVVMLAALGEQCCWTPVLRCMTTVHTGRCGCLYTMQQLPSFLESASQKREQKWSPSASRASSQRHSTSPEVLTARLLCGVACSGGGAAYAPAQAAAGHGSGGGAVGAHGQLWTRGQRRAADAG